MVAQLYSADILDTAVPVKKRAKKCTDKTDPIDPTQIEESVEPKQKKPRTEKQIAAFEKAKETRRLKKEAREQEVMEAAAKQKEIDDAIAQKETLKQEKKEAAKEKRRLAKETKAAEKMAAILTPEPSEISEPNPEPNPEPEPSPKPILKKRKTKAYDPTIPPPWFLKYVEGVKSEENNVSKEKKPKKQVKIEAQEVAVEQWKDEFTRDRVANEVNSHVDRMYTTIFGRRKM